MVTGDGIDGLAAKNVRPGSPSAEVVGTRWLLPKTTVGMNEKACFRMMFLFKPSSGSCSNCSEEGSSHLSAPKKRPTFFGKISTVKFCPQGWPSQKDDASPPHTPSRGMPGVHQEYGKISYDGLKIYPLKKRLWWTQPEFHLQVRMCRQETRLSSVVFNFSSRAWISTCHRLVTILSKANLMNQWETRRDIYNDYNQHNIYNQLTWYLQWYPTWYHCPNYIPCSQYLPELSVASLRCQLRLARKIWADPRSQLLLQLCDLRLGFEEWRVHQLGMLRLKSTGWIHLFNLCSWPRMDMNG